MKMEIKKLLEDSLNIDLSEFGMMNFSQTSQFNTAPHVQFSLKTGVVLRVHSLHG